MIPLGLPRSVRERVIQTAPWVTGGFFAGAGGADALVSGLPITGHLERDITYGVCMVIGMLGGWCGDLKKKRDRAQR
jgi:hypothetical protein